MSTLFPFTMQMSFVVMGGYVVAVSAPVQRVVEVLARLPKSPRVAVAHVAFVAIVTSPWALGLSSFRFRLGLIPLGLSCVVALGNIFYRATRVQRRKRTAAVGPRCNWSFGPIRTALVVLGITILWRSFSNVLNVG